VAVTGAVLVVSGCSPLPSFTNDANSAIQAASHTPLPSGYKISSISGGENSFDFQNPEYTMHLVKKNVGSAPADECAVIIDYARSLGATHWFDDGSFPPLAMFPIDSHPAQAQIGCVNVVGYLWDDSGVVNPDGATPVFKMWGENTDLLLGKTVPLIFEFNIGDGQIQASVSSMISAKHDSEGLWDAFRSWTWDEALAALDPDQRFFLTALDAIGQFRATRTKASKESVSLLQAAFDKANLDATLGSIEVMKDKKTGRVFAHLTPAGGSLLDKCVSLAAFDPEYFGVADPGFGYGTGYSDGWQFKDEFGTGPAGTCPPVDPNAAAAP
jgi:hypothetical protein